MQKITDNGYVLPLVEALGPIQVFDTGANKPLLIRGVTSNGQKGDFVVKFRAAERLSTEAFARELLAAFIAAQMEITSVKPVIVNISQDFVNVLDGHPAWQTANNSLGLNYGSEYIQKFITIPIRQPLNNHQLPFAQLIFAFDVLIQNPDRTTNKPNMITNGTEIVIFDHELAFSFVLDIFNNPRPWEIRDADLVWINLHCLWEKIKGHEFDFEDFSRRFDNLDDNFWNVAWNLMPVGWRNDQFGKIKDHIQSIKDNKDAFILELKKLMS